MAPERTHDITEQRSHASSRLPPRLTVLVPPRCEAYELLDSGDGKKLERFGRYRLVRPESQAIWSPALPPHEWERVDAHFQRTRGDDSGPGEWMQKHPLPAQWPVRFGTVTSLARLTPFRHTGIFPEHSAHWEWMRQQLRQHPRQPSVLVLFGYTGLNTLVAAHAGAQVCHVDASRPAIRWAQENQRASHLEDKPIRWIVDDALAFVQREVRRGSRYDMIVMDPPVFGRGPRGELWRLHEALPSLVAHSVRLLSDHPLGIVLHAYATTISSLALANVLAARMIPFGGDIVAGELALIETSAGRPLPTALFARWSN